MGHLLPVGGMSEVVVGWEDRFDKLSEFELERVSFFSGEKYALLKENGKYNCGRCGCTLYTSKNKFIPHAPLNDFASFREPANLDAVNSKRVYSFGMKRTEALCGQCHLHLGYVFPDGVASGDRDPSASERHCILSFCLKFIPELDESTKGLSLSTSPISETSEKAIHAQLDAGNSVSTNCAASPKMEASFTKSNLPQSQIAKVAPRTSLFRVIAPLFLTSLLGSALAYWV